MMLEASTSLYEMVTPSPKRDSKTLTPAGAAGNCAIADEASASRAMALDAAMVARSEMVHATSDTSPHY